MQKYSQPPKSTHSPCSLLHHCSLFSFQIEVISRELRLSVAPPSTAAGGSSSSSSAAASNSSNSSSSGLVVKSDPGQSQSEVQTLLRLRLAPHRGDKVTEILAECSLDHPFFVKDKGRQATKQTSKIHCVLSPPEVRKRSREEEEILYKNYSIKLRAHFSWKIIQM